MPDHLPLLIFPQLRSIQPSKGQSFPPSKPHFPAHSRQLERLRPMLDNLRQDFDRFRGTIDRSVSGLEPEMVLVLEIAGSVERLQQAVEAAGLEWLSEWDIEDDPDDDFYEPDKNETKKDRPLGGRLFVSLLNERGLQQLLRLWNQWEQNKSLPTRQGKWKDVFSQLRKIRRWGINEILMETGMIEHWKEELRTVNSEEEMTFQIEFFYRQSQDKRQQMERNIVNLLGQEGGKTLGSFLDIPEIAFSAVKASLPVPKIQEWVDACEEDSDNLDINLLKFPGLMYILPTGQSMATSEDGEIVTHEFPDGKPELPPVAAILDGLPNMQHDALRDRVVLDDMNNLSGEYLLGERRHGSEMASLIIHGDLGANNHDPINRELYCIPVLQPDKKARAMGKRVEHFPTDVFYEDRIERAVRRMFEGDDVTEPQAPHIKIINISLGDIDRPFIHSLSPWARLLDWLSWKYRVLFCVSAGNYEGSFDFGMPHQDFAHLGDDEKTRHFLEQVDRQLSQRRLLAPAESINALTVGALHTDESPNYYLGQRIDLYGEKSLFSPISRLGFGFRRSVKPEVFFPGGKQLYNVPPRNADQEFTLATGTQAPGQRTAWDSDAEGANSQTTFIRGTSNAAALSTRAGIKVHGMLTDLNQAHDGKIPDNLMAVMIKALLVHGAKQDDHQKDLITRTLKNSRNSRQFKRVLSRYLGYGSVDVERVLSCTEQRGTVIGCSEIQSNEVHQYRFPIPDEFSGQGIFRRMVVTLAWFSPINPRYRYLREAKLEIQPATKWDETPLELRRIDGDHNQVKRGTVQHEIVEGENELAQFQQGEEIVLEITCKKDATEKLEEFVPYGLAVTLEAAEGSQIPVYEKIRERLVERVEITEA